VRKCPADERKGQGTTADTSVERYAPCPPGYKARQREVPLKALDVHSAGAVIVFIRCKNNTLALDEGRALLGGAVRTVHGRAQ
jgi:hypothetical protein